MDVVAAAQHLADMRRTKRVVADLPEALRPRSLAEGYRVQAALVELLLGTGERPIGYKVACTSETAQQALEVAAPMYARLLPGTSSASGCHLDADRFVHRVIEAEFAFRLGSDVEPISGGHTRATVAGYIDAVIPAIEVVDYRYHSWAIGAPQVAADNAIHGWWVAGQPVTDWRHLDLADVRVEVGCDGEAITTGSGAAVLGDPLEVMTWLANELPDHGLSLRAGDLVTTGVTTDVFEAEAGQHITASFEGIGLVELTFV